MLGFWFGLDKEILFSELMSSFSKDSQKLHISLISQFITQHLSPAIGLLVFLRLILVTSNPLWLISSTKEGIKWILINSWNGFFSIGSSFLGLGIGLTGGLFSFVFDSLSWIFIFSDLTSFVATELDLLTFSVISFFVTTLVSTLFFILLTFSFVFDSLSWIFIFSDLTSFVASELDLFKF